MIKKIAILALALLIAGCSSSLKTDKLVSKILLPVNITAAYFSSVAIHEAGHALPAYGYGAKAVKVDVLPVKRNGKWHLGYTKAYIDLDGTDEVVFHTMGSTAQFASHLGARALLKTNKVPRLIQPYLGWLSIFGQIGYYSHVLSGVIGQDKQADLVKCDPWISWTMLAGGVTIDLLDILISDEPISKRFMVLFGEDFYEEKEQKHLSLITTPGFIGFRLEW